MGDRKGKGQSPKPREPMERLMSIKEVGEILGVTASTVTKLMDFHGLAWLQIGSNRKVRPSELQHFLEEAQRDPKRRPYRKTGKHKKKPTEETNHEQAKAPAVGQDDSAVER